MRELPQDYLAKVLEGETERRNLEFKPPFLWKDSDSERLRQKIVRAILGLSNTPSGGLLVLGIDQSKDGTSQLIGLNDEQLSSFENAEAIKGHVDGFASVATAFELTAGGFCGPEVRDFSSVRVREATNNLQEGRRRPQDPADRRDLRTLDSSSVLHCAGNG